MKKIVKKLKGMSLNYECPKRNLLDRLVDIPRAQGLWTLREIIDEQKDMRFSFYEKH